MDRSQHKAAAAESVADEKKVEQAVKDRAATAKKATAEALSDTAVAERAKSELIDAANRRRIDASKKAMMAEERAGMSMIARAKEGASAIGNLANSYANFATVASVVNAVGEMWKAHRLDIEGSIKGLADYREHVLGITALKGNLGRSTPEVASQLEFRSRTLQTREGATATQEGMFNTGQAGIASGFVGKDDFAKFMEYVGSLQAANPKLDAKALGTLAGSMPSLIGEKGQSPEQLFRRLVGLTRTFEIGGADPGPAVSQFQSNAALVAPGMFKSPEQMAALQSMFSLTSPDKAGTLTRQFVRGTVGGLTRMRGSPFEGSEKQAEYLKGLNATDQMDPVQIGILIAEDMKRKAAATPKGRVFNPMTYLTMHGYQDEEARQAVMDFSKRYNSGEYGKTYAPGSTPGSAPGFGEAMKPVQDFQKVDPVAMTRKSDIATDVANATKSMGPEEFYDRMKRIAFEKLRADPKSGVSGKYEEWSTDKIWSGRLIDEAKKMLDEEAKRVGVKPPELEFGDRIPQIMTLGTDSMLGGMMGAGQGRGVMGGGFFDRFVTSEQTRAKAFFDYGQKIREAGGTTGDIKPMVEELKKVSGLLQRAEDRALRGGKGDAVTPPPVRIDAAGGRPTR